MHTDETNEYGCPLRNQTGAAGVQNFIEIIAGLSSELRAAFEAERNARQEELDSYVAVYGYRT
ncbi:MAG: hypothetical protein RLZZ387_5592 [Chloroflexota bacterium]|jgi:hypothetical protein